MATKKEADARDVLDSGTGNELSAITVKSLTNLEEKVDAIDWKLWEKSLNILCAQTYIHHKHTYVIIM